MNHPELKENSIKRREKWDEINTYQKHYLSAEQVLEYSEQEIATFFEEEIKFLREIESLRKEFFNEFGRTVYEIFRAVDYKENGFIDYETLMGFLHKYKIGKNFKR